MRSRGPTGAAKGRRAAAPRPDLLARLAARVRQLRKERGLTARALAEQAGLSLRFVAQLEAGQANIAVLRLEAVARALGVSAAALVADAPATGAGGGVGGARTRLDALLAGRAPEELERCVDAVEAALGQARRRGVALLGLRGAGKSTLGPRLAAALGVPFVELDDRIEEAAGLSLTELFALHGEAYYRRLEMQVLSALLAGGRPFVVALGGGIVQNDEAFRLARAHCTTVWLRARPEDHMQRVLAQGDRRPMAGRDDAMAELEAILAAREPLYRQAELTVDTSHHGERTLDALLRAVDRAGWAAAAR
ncbi:MAG: helix-turn-helix domain-containing protein [Planctomycetes bacterium]|nr:helix-turn-helix domain-containing protein [Planctomycetota bacterium]